MARKRHMLQRRINVNPVQQIVSQKQSTETVQMMLFGSISSLFYRRAVFPRCAFEEVTVDTSLNDISYDNLVSGNAVNTHSTINGNKKLHLMQKGKSSRVDTFFDVLEKGVFDALQRKVLSAVHFDIVTDTLHLNNALESYIFKIKYKDIPESGREVQGLQFNPSRQTDHENPKFVEVLQQVEARVADLCLSPLPENRHLVAHLHYVDDCDGNYEAPGFKASVDSDVVIYPKGNGWHNQTRSMNATRGPFHDFGLKICYLQHESHSKQLQAGEGAKDGLSIRRFSGEQVLKANVIIHNGGNEALHRTGLPSVPNPTGSAEDKQTPEITTSQTPSNDTSTSVRSVTRPAVQTANMDLDLPLHGLPSKSSTELPQAHSRLDLDERTIQHLQCTTTLEEVGQGESQSISQALDDMRMRDDLRRIHEPEHLPQYLVPTQLAFGFSQEDAIGVRAVERPKSPSEERQGRDDDVHCACGLEGVEGLTITCGTCDREQHPQCYGYLGVDDPRLQSEHTCYECLLGDSQPEVYDEVVRLADMRQLIHITLVEKILDEETLKAHLVAFGIEPKYAEAMLQRATEEGYIIITRASQRHSQSQDSRRLRVVALDRRNGLDDKFLKLFNPSLRVETYVGYV
ncbi:hypothetical protein AAFC00_004756 [Neodothiora populina]|uniref:HORMA domain-containing protein n=1 Tax=Neodothiora populina TaxID=2781224 RepID=A0ABR3P3D8_9PEZI